MVSNPSRWCDLDLRGWELKCDFHSTIDRLFTNLTSAKALDHLSAGSLPGISAIIPIRRPWTTLNQVSDTPVVRTSVWWLTALRYPLFALLLTPTDRPLSEVLTTNLCWPSNTDTNTALQGVCHHGMILNVNCLNCNWMSTWNALTIQNQWGPSTPVPSESPFTSLKKPQDQLFPGRKVYSPHQVYDDN